MEAAAEAARAAIAADVPRLAELCRMAQAELAPTRGGLVYVAREARAEPFEDSLRDELGRPGHAIFAGTLDEVVVGYASVAVEVLRDGQLLGAIAELFVEPAAREAGVGEALMTALVEWATARGCAGMDATALPGNRATKNFFEANGFTARLLVMHHRLAPAER